MATTATPGSTASPAEAAPALVHRFGGTERALHWVHAAGFVAMFATGLLLLLPSLAALVDRPAAKALHLASAGFWLTALAAIALGGDRAAVRRTRRELEALTDDDVRWLRGGRTPAGRFNAGQKLHAAVQAALAVLFVFSGTLLWLGERSTAFRLPGTVALHDGAMAVALALLTGHLWLSLVWPATRPALRGIVRGDVRAGWARHHHPAWTPPAVPPARVRTSGRRRAVVVAVVLVGLALTGVVAIGERGTSVAADADVPVTPVPPDADELARQAQEASTGGDLARAAALLERAVAAAPDRTDLRVALGLALAQGNELGPAATALEAAIERDPSALQARLLLGQVLAQGGDEPGARRALREVLRLAAPGSPEALAAQELLEAAGAG